MPLTTSRSIIIDDEVMFSGRNSYETIGFPQHLVNIYDPIGLAGDEFGKAVATGDSRIVVGSPAVSVANLFDANGTHITDLVDPLNDIADEFGDSVAVGNGVVVVGAPRDAPTNTGSAHIFDLEGNYIARIVDPNGGLGHYFGFSVAVGDGRIVVGALGNSQVCVFDLKGNFLTSMSEEFGDNFGNAVAVGNGRIVVGSPTDTTVAGANAGSVSIFDLDGNLIIKALDPIAISGDQLGTSVAVGCGKIAAGAPYDEGPGFSNGSVVVWDLNGNHIMKLTDPNTESADQLGHSVGIGNGRIISGAYKDGGVADEGSISVWDFYGNYVTKIVNPTPFTPPAYFGLRLAIGNGKIVAGSYGANSNKGEVSIFSVLDYVHMLDIVDKKRGAKGYYAPVVPINFTNLLSWYDFSDTSTLYQDTGYLTPATANGHIIRAVVDKGLGGINLTKDAQSPTDKDITLVTNAHLGRSMAKGNTYENFNIAYLSNTAYGTALTDFFVAGVIQVDSIDFSEGRLFVISNGATAEATLSTNDGVDLTPYLWIDGISQSGYSPTDLTKTRLNVTVGFYWWAPYGVGDGVWEVYGLGSNTRAAIHTTLPSTNKIGLFGNTNTTFTGKIGEMVVARSTTLAERKGVLEYFNQKWQL